MHSSFTHYLLLGPVLGAGMGLAQVVVAAMIWIAHGRPDFYFRGEQGVVVTLVLVPFGGLVAGIPFGAAVLVAEKLLRRRVGVALGMACAIAASVGVAWAMVEYEFSREELLPEFVQLGVAVALSGGALLASSRQRKPDAPDGRRKSRR